MVKNAPTSGRLAFADDLQRRVDRFTQADVNEDRVLYVHDGSLTPVDFYFSVSDGHHKPVYRHFRIVVLPLELRLVNSSRYTVEIKT